MARYNEILVGALNRGLQKHLAMKGEPPAPQLSSEIQPAFNLWNGVENRYLFSWNRYGSFGTTAAVAAQNSGIKFRNPAGSNVVAVFEQIRVRQGTAGVAGVNLAITAADISNFSGGVLAAARKLDQRIIGGSGSTLIGSFGNNVSGVSSAYAIPLLTVANNDYDMILFEEHEIPLFPGDSWSVVTGDVNITVTLQAIWRERFLEDSERT